MSEQKLSTAEILAKIRAAKPAASGDAPASPPTPAPAAESPPVDAVPDKPKATPAPKPGSTSDILAAIRAQGAKGSAAPAADAPKAPASKPAAAKPGSTADVLAAIRAGKSGAAVEPAGDAPASKSVSVAKSVASVAGSGPKLSVEEMLKAVRGENPAETAPGIAAAAVPVKPVLPPIPVKPPAAKDKKAGSTDRRSFVAVCFTPLVIAFGSMAATSLLWLLDLARFMFPNVLVEPPTKFKIGTPSDYPLGGVSTKWLAARGVWIVHTDQYKGRNLIYALASVCTHLGCTPNWLEGEQKYKCPCHGSGFYVNGINFEGPAPRPLERVGIKLASDGQLEVDKSVKFQEEMGQWEDPNSFVDGTLV